VVFVSAATPIGAEFDTAGPARIDLSMHFGGVRLVASSRSTTMVMVRPLAESRRADVDLAGATQATFSGGVVAVAVPPWRRLSSLIRPGAIEVVIETPHGASVRADLGYAAFLAEGRLGRAQVKSSYGDVRIDEVDEVKISTSGGQVSLGLVHHQADVSNSYGHIGVGDVRGSCVLRNSSGDISVGTARGEVTVRSAYGHVDVERAVSGSLEVVTSYGATVVGIAAGSAVHLDVFTKNGQVLNALTATDTPSDPTEAVQLRARSGWGDVTIRRSPRHEGDR
jgi:hypothetical protein